jgi:hypothetical protein
VVQRVNVRMPGHGQVWQCEVVVICQWKYACVFPQQISDEAWREVRDAQSRTHRASHPQHSRTSIAQRTKVAVSLPHCEYGTGFEYGNHKKESAANSAICREEHTSSRAHIALHWPTTVRRQPPHRKQTKHPPTDPHDASDEGIDSVVRHAYRDVRQALGRHAEVVCFWSN